jgi:starch synthase
MRILFVASEVVPFVKTGGLADVVGALPKTLAARGHDVRIVLPKYRSIDSQKFNLLPLMPEMKVRYGNDTFSGEVMRTSYPGTDIPVYFIDLPHLFDRDGVYNSQNHDYLDNDRRFASFNLATLWMLKGLDWAPDVMHIHDWPTGLIPALLKFHPEVKSDEFFAKIKTVLTIHNLAYQGNFVPQLVADIGLPWSTFTSEGMEFFGRASMLKSAIVFSDLIATVSPTYANEIRTETYGAGLDGILRACQNRLVGILNGIDTKLWDPANDPNIPAKIHAVTGAGRAECKAALQAKCGFPQKKHVPLIGMATRLTGQKGIDLAADALNTLLAADIQMVLLGSGEERFENFFREIANRFPKKFAAKLAYDESLAHQIYAGSDMFLIPSAFEPCGLTQMYAMRYGAVPIARATGGLVDTVADASIRGIEEGRSTGFLFADYNTPALLGALQKAVSLFRDDQPHWDKLRRNAMARDFSWETSAAAYEALYERAVAPAAK